MSLPGSTTSWIGIVCGMVVTMAAMLAGTVVLRSARRMWERYVCSEFDECVPQDVPSLRDLSRSELRRFARALAAGRLPPDASSRIVIAFNVRCRQQLHGTNPNVRPQQLETATSTPNFVRLAGVATAFMPCSAGQADEALAWLLVFPGGVGRLPRSVGRFVLRRCPEVEWHTIEPELACRALRYAFRRRPGLPVWRRLLGAMARCGNWDDTERVCVARPAYMRAAKQGLQSADGDMQVKLGWFRSAPVAEALLSAEVIGKMYLHRERFDTEVARDWYIPLIRRSAQAFVSRQEVAAFVCERLGQLPPAHVPAAAKAIENGVDPSGPDDYSNFQSIFSMRSWTLLRPHLNRWVIVRELDLFVTAHDRISFWSQLT